MYLNLINFRGDNKSLAIRTNEPLRIENFNSDESTCIMDDSTGAVLECFVDDILYISSVKIPEDTNDDTEQ